MKYSFALLLFVICSVANAQSGKSKNASTPHSSNSNEKLAKKCLAEYAKEKLNDPASAYVISYEVSKYEDAKRVDVVFSAANALGGKVRSSTACVMEGSDIAQARTVSLRMRLIIERNQREIEELESKRYVN